MVLTYYLLFQCHFSYSVCGLGSDGTDRLVQLVQEIQHGKLPKSKEGQYMERKLLVEVPVEQFV